MTCSSRTPLRTVTPIDTADDATSTHGTRVNRAPRNAILATGVAMPTKRWIASVTSSVSSLPASTRFASAADLTWRSDESSRSNACCTTSPAARSRERGMASAELRLSSLFVKGIFGECPRDENLTRAPTSLASRRWRA
jgi:hypothetical protein